jgi:hypothetical protein
MRLALHYRKKICMILTAILLLPMTALAGPPAKAIAEEKPQSPMSVDVTLVAGGVLQGYVVDAQGVPAAEVEVQLTAPNGQFVVATSDAKGRFGYRGLEGGAYQLETEYGLVNCRVWTAQAAPPRSAATLLVVHDEQVARGQRPAPPQLNGFVSRMKRVMTDPLAVALIVGAAVAIPVGVHNANQDDNPSS